MNKTTQKMLQRNRSFKRKNAQLGMLSIYWITIAVLLLLYMTIK